MIAVFQSRLIGIPSVYFVLTKIIFLMNGMFKKGKTNSCAQKISEMSMKVKNLTSVLLVIAKVNLRIYLFYSVEFITVSLSYTYSFK
jgi:hypothetical protein